MVGTCEWGKEPFFFHKIRGIFLLDEKWLAFQEGVCSMEQLVRVVLRENMLTDEQTQSLYIYIYKLIK